MKQASSTFADSKRHFKILDGLRGVAAITVVVFHLLETFSGGDHTKQILNHGYLAVDFFFLLSGFVVGYAYDDRWGRMSLRDFFTRRLIRLHPMIIAGMLIGAVTFYFQASSLWPAIGNTSLPTLLLITLVGCTLLPLPTAFDVRGWAEMHPLDGPAWSLFFEYVANILYALLLRRLTRGWLAVFVVLAGAALVHLAVSGPTGDLIGGWSLEPAQFRIGLTRLLFPFFAGLLLCRGAPRLRVKGAFGWCSLLLLAALAAPRIGGTEHLWQNGLYDSLCVVFVFPLIVWLGAGGDVVEGREAKVCRFLGDVSYPLYIIHYPFIYWFMAWVVDNGLGTTPIDALPAGVWGLAAGVLALTLLLAYALLKGYDEPVRRWLTARLLPAKGLPKEGEKSVARAAAGNEGLTDKKIGR